jgi:hypothetical protein
VNCRWILVRADPVASVRFRHSRDWGRGVPWPDRIMILGRVAILRQFDDEILGGMEAARQGLGIPEG